MALGATLMVAGVTVMDCSATTVRVAEPFTPDEEAEIVVVPPPAAVAKPEVLTVATDPLEESQFAVAVRFFVVPSL